MITITLPNGDIMRKPRSCLVTKGTVFLLLSVVALAQTGESAQDPAAESNQENEVAVKALESAGFFQKLGNFVDLSKRLEDLSKVAERLEAIEDKISKMKPTTPQLPPQLSSPASSTPQQVAPPAVPAAPAYSKPAQSNTTAERVSNDSFGLVSGDGVGDDNDVPMPFLNDNTPEWVKSGLRNGQSTGDDRSFVISSSLLPDLEQCNDDLKSRMMSEIRVYLKKNVLEYEDAKLPQLTQEYVEKYWLKRDQLFDNVQDRPSGTYHQLWLGLRISSEQLAKVRGWEKQSERDLRIKKAGVVGGLGVFAITLLSGAVGLLARREKAKLKG